jgi:tetratricopeptide (TPR) repeat protein
MEVTTSLNILANYERLSGDLVAAERDYSEGFRIARANGDAQNIANITGNLGGLALGREDWPGAEALAREALVLWEKVGRQDLIAWNCLRLGRALVRQGKAAETLPHARVPWKSSPNLVRPTSPLPWLSCGSARALVSSTTVEPGRRAPSADGA